MLFGAPAELVLLPSRAARPGVPGSGRQTFAPSHAARIQRDESLWQDERHVLTPNRWPFARGQSILWRRDGGRELDAALLARAFAAVDDGGGCMLGNAIGAAASIPEAHVHLCDEEMPFLRALPAQPLPMLGSEDLAGIETARLSLPVLVLRLRGDADARANAAAELLRIRRAAACNVVAMHGECWLFPRSGVETPAPEFPHALGASEVWGRWCFSDERAFERADAPALERALAVTGVAQ